MKPVVPVEKISIYQAQVMHHETLYIECIPDAIKQKYSNTDGLSELEVELFVHTSLQWELDEIIMVGYIGLFHLWEKHTKELLSFVLKKKFRNWPKLSGISHPTYPKKVIEHLKNLNIQIEKKIFNAMQEANSVVNAWKHGDDALEKLHEQHKDYFYEKDNINAFHIPKIKLTELFIACNDFWSSIEGQVEYDFSCFTKRKN